MAKAKINARNGQLNPHHQEAGRRNPPSPGVVSISEGFKRQGQRVELPYDIKNWSGFLRRLVLCKRSKSEPLPYGPELMGAFLKAA